MFHGLKKLLRKSAFVRKTYRRYVHPRLPQYELEVYILRRTQFDRCIDVGANEGVYSILLSRHADRVYAFEPVGHLFEDLRGMNIENLSVYNLALGNETKEMEISFPAINGEACYALSTLRPVVVGENEKIERQRVRVAKFDDFAGEIDFERIDFVKIDVEGFELEVLHGMKDLVESKGPALMIEIEQRHNPRYLEVFDYLHALHYQPYVTEDGISIRALEMQELPNIQASFELNSTRKFSRGEQRNYINNFFFLRSNHKSLFPVKQEE